MTAKMDAHFISPYRISMNKIWIGNVIFQVPMGVISIWMMSAIPGKTLIYILLTGLIEMVVLGILNGLILKANSAVIRN